MAVAGSIDRDGPVEEIRVVSDGISWCRDHLGFLTDQAPLVSFSSPTDSPVTNFFELATAQRLVITNSTISYWAAMPSNSLHGDNHGQVCAPRFFDRTANDGRSTLVDERWSIVETNPGGWNLKESASENPAPG